MQGAALLPNCNAPYAPSFPLFSAGCPSKFWTPSCRSVGVSCVQQCFSAGPCWLHVEELQPWSRQCLTVDACRAAGNPLKCELARIVFIVMVSCGVT